VTTPEVRAAGGVVLRVDAARRVEVLLVHRPGHQDWTLPKGKADPEESDEACALREVAEETGLGCALGPELATTRYLDRRGRRKAVRYWAMTARAGRFTPNAEVDAVRWCPLAEAAALLSYSGDRLVLEAVAPALRALVFLVRHGSAAEGARPAADDRHRPLDARGRRQARALAAPLGGYPARRLLSSPADRCVQTLEPLSARLALPVEHDPGLVAGAPAAATEGSLARLGPGPLVLCTHEDVIANLVGAAAPRETGAVWLLGRDAGAVRPIRYWPPEGET
jgi:8-oxo-dGTP diphosphatase